MFDFSIVTTFIDNLLRQTLGLGDFLSILIECVLVGICILTAYALIAIVLIFMERKVCAYFQCRLGPMRVGPWGIFQVFADVLKMFISTVSGRKSVTINSALGSIFGGRYIYFFDGYIDGAIIFIFLFFLLVIFNAKFLKKSFFIIKSSSYLISHLS